MSNIIEVRGLTKCFKEVEAVKGIDFNVEKGSLFAFLGTNGAGKSTTIEILCTIQEKSSGEVTIDGHILGTLKANEAIRKSIGVVFQQSILDEMLTVRENIWHRGKFYRLTKQQLNENYHFVKEKLKLDEIENKKYGQLSGGQKRRADIARALIHRPKILFLDEPTTGLDPQTRKLVWAVIDELRSTTEMTIFLTTHYMEEAALADQIVIIRKGEIIAQGAPHILKEQYAKDQLILFFKENSDTEILDTLQLSYHKRGEAVVVPIESTLDSISILEKIHDELSSFEVIKGSLDDVFLQVNEGSERHVS